jgi:hypothetical protein
LIENAIVGGSAQSTQAIFLILKIIQTCLLKLP